MTQGKENIVTKKGQNKVKCPLTPSPTPLTTARLPHTRSYTPKIIAKSNANKSVYKTKAHPAPEMCEGG